MTTRKHFEELRGKYLGECHRWGNTVVIEVYFEELGTQRAKGLAEEKELTPGCWYRWFGRWSVHYRYGDQFQFQTFTETESLDEDGMLIYLCAAPNIGKVTAKKLISLYGQDAVRKLREDPEGCAEKVKFRGDRGGAIEAAEYLESKKSLEDVTIDLTGLLAGKGFPKRLLKKCIEKWGNNANKVIRADPYCLLRFNGVGFGRTDALYLELGLDPNAIKRQGLCALYSCSSDSDGNTWLSGNAIHGDLLKKIGATEARPRQAVEWALEVGVMEKWRDERGIWFSDAERAKSEQGVANRAAVMMEHGCSEWPCPSSFEGLSEHQSGQLFLALVGRLALLIGSPGTGKTYCAARLIKALVQRHGQDQVAVVAPTGKAAVRVREAMTENGIGLGASTIHSFLEVGQADEDEGFSFIRGPDFPVEQRFVICDEASMLDVWLLEKLLSALPVDGHLLLIGDVNQLPPVGHGAPLRDLIKAEIPCGSLTEIRRNAGAIVETCAAIRDEQNWGWNVSGSLSLDQGKNLVLRNPGDEQAQADYICSALERIGSIGQHDPVWECQVIVAVNERSKLSRKVLNARIQAELNAANRPRKDSAFWPNDKVVCLKNSWFPAVDPIMNAQCGSELREVRPIVRTGDDGSTQIYVANGELGRVIQDTPTTLVVEFSAPSRTVVVPKGDKGTDSIDLGYALSCHKSQGSEWPVVLVALDEHGGARMVCDRSWLYTSISRAKTACILVGKLSTAQDMVSRVKIRGRKTFLCEQFAKAVERIREKREEDPEESSDTELESPEGGEVEENHEGEESPTGVQATAPD